MKIVFFGSGQFVEPVREELRNNFDLITDIKDCDLIVVASYGKILSKEILNTPKYGAINIHPSDLPKYRGSSPIQSQILDGVKNSAVTFIKMDEEVDHGPILEKISFEISDNDTFESAVARAFKLASGQVAEVIERYVNNRINAVLQDDSKATFTKILKKEDGFIDLDSSLNPETLNKMVRAYYPWPGVWLKFKVQNEKLKVIKLLPNKKIQVEGKTPMDYKDFINGYENGGELLKKLHLDF